MATVNATTIVRKGYEAVVLLAGDEIPEWALSLIHISEPTRPY